MFDLLHHQLILQVLRSLNAELFTEVQAYFGGGTLITLLHGEYRWSKDIDFMCPYGSGYSLLRGRIADNGYNALFNNTSGLRLPREITTDQYGVRFPVFVTHPDGINETLIKFEIIAEGRIELDPPRQTEWCPVPCLDHVDACAEKLLANADRWGDTSVESRDLIDLAILRLQSSIPQMAYDKAEKAYPVIEPLKKAIIYFQNHAQHREKCFAALQIKDTAGVIDGIDLLASDHKMEPTPRTQNEDEINL